VTAVHMHVIAHQCSCCQCHYWATTSHNRDPEVAQSCSDLFKQLVYVHDSMNAGGSEGMDQRRTPLQLRCRPVTAEFSRFRKVSRLRAVIHKGLWWPFTAGGCRAPLIRQHYAGRGCAATHAFCKLLLLQLSRVSRAYSCR